MTLKRRDFLSLAGIAAAAGVVTGLHACNNKPKEEKDDSGSVLKSMTGDVVPISISERKEAIKTAVRMANPLDILLIAGKGHEKYQDIKGIKYPFDDKLVLAEMFELYGK